MKEQLWLVNGGKIVYNCIKNFVKCFRFQSKSTPQLMADLPSECVTPARAFSTCGKDFAGPFNVQYKKNPIIYIAVFFCLVAKAIHLELVSSLTKEDCIMALTRFTSRRGAPKKIITDNGSNFIGGRNDFLQIQALLNKETVEGKQLLRHLKGQGTEWVMISPRAPHFDRIWEAAVKSMKRHLRRILGLQTLKYEELLKIFQQIEAILNSRPLFPMSDDPNDCRAITPAHFIIGDSLLWIVREDIDAPAGHRVKLLQRIQQDFWKSWSRDYLAELQIRKKWFRTGPCINEGDLVLVAEDNEAPLVWKLARVSKLFKGNNEIPRVAEIKTSKKTFNRPIIELRKLPLAESLVDRTPSGPWGKKMTEYFGYFRYILFLLSTLSRKRVSPHNPFGIGSAGNSLIATY